MTPTPTPPTQITTPESDRAYRFSRRRETRKPDGTVRQRAGCLTHLSIKTSSPVTYMLNPKCAARTASWQWKAAGVGSRHIIEVNPDCATVFFAEDKNNSKRRIELVKAVIAHETCHGLYTSRSPDLPRACHSLKVPFRLLNLFEDCRIEHKYVNDRGKEFKFRWRAFDDNMVKAGGDISSPMTWMYTMKTREPILFKAASSVMAGYKWTGEDSVSLPSTSYAHPLKKVEGRLVYVPSLINIFYRAIIDAATTEDVVPIARYWTDIFGRESASDLPPIIIDTVPSDIGGVDEPAGADEGESSDADRTTREVDHRALEELGGGDPTDKRAMLTPDKVMHHNTDKFVKQPPRAGFIPLLRYCVGFEGDTSV